MFSVRLIRSYLVIQLACFKIYLLPFSLFVFFVFRMRNFPYFFPKNFNIFIPTSTKSESVCSNGVTFFDLTFDSLKKFRNYNSVNAALVGFVWDATYSIATLFSKTFAVVPFGAFHTQCTGHLLYRLIEIIFEKGRCLDFVVYSINHFFCC